jgi:acetyl esterase/lipase
MAGLGLGLAAPALGRPAQAGATAADAASGEPDAWVALWPGSPPGAPAILPREAVVQRASDPALSDRIMQNIAKPRMAVFRPAQPSGAAVLIMPGGGYRHVVIDKEGFEMACWAAARGITAFVLFYRLPDQGWASGPDTPLADAMRALRLLRHRHAEFGIDPARIGIMGFSAGGHVAASLATRFAAPVYPPHDEADTISARPDAAALIYPVIAMSGDLAHPGSRERLLGTAPPAVRELAHSPAHTMPADAPPFFLLHAEDDDAVPVGNALALHAAARARGIAVDMHLFMQGGHGFGLRRAAGKPVARWPDLWLDWAKAAGVA